MQGQDAEMLDNLQNQGQLASLSAIARQDHLFYVSQICSGLRF